MHDIHEDSSLTSIYFKFTRSRLRIELITKQSAKESQTWASEFRWRHDGGVQSASWSGMHVCARVHNVDRDSQKCTFQGPSTTKEPMVILYTCFFGQHLNDQQRGGSMRILESSRMVVTESRWTCST